MNIKVCDNIKNLKPYQPGKPMEELQRELGIPLKDIVKLASNENPLGPSPRAVEAIESFAKGVNRYPDGDCFYLKDKLARYLGVKPYNLLMGNGSDEIIEIAVKTFAGKGDKVVISEPAFLEYSVISRTKGCRVKTIPMKKVYKDGMLSGFEYDIDKILKSIDKKTRIIFLGNPDNPTGAYLCRQDLEVFIDRCPGHVIVVIDEAYNELVDKDDCIDAIKYKNKKNVVILRTFSKAYGLAGLRVGYAIADKSLVAWMDRARQPFNVNMLAQKAAEAALDDKAFIEKSRSVISSGKRFLVGSLKRLGFNVIESPANFILFSCRKISGTGLFSRLLSHGVIIRDMKPYGLNSWARVSVGTMKQNRKFIKALRAIDRSRPQ